MTDGKQQTLPSRWIVTTLDQVARWGSGGTPSRKYPHFYNGSIPWIKTGELNSKYVRSSEESITKEAILKSSAKVFPTGSVGLAMYGATIGKLSIWGIDASTNQACAVAQPYTEVLINEFLYYFLLSEKHRLIEAGKGGAQSNISQRILKRWPICIPSLAEQRRIVSKIEELFSELDKGVESLEKAREQLKVYRQAVLKHAFEGKLTEQWRQENQDKFETPDQLLARIKSEREAQLCFNNKRLTRLPREWKFAKLQEVAEINPRLNKSAFTDNLTVSFVPMPAVEAGTGIIDVSHTRPFHKVKKGYRHFQENDVLFAKITPCMENGKMAVVPPLKNELGFGSTEFHVLRASNKVSAQYVFYFVSSEQFRKIAQHNMTGAVGQRRVPTTYLANQHIPIPPLHEQHVIVAKIKEVFSQTDRLLRIVDAQLIKTKSLHQSILKKAFTGSLVAQDPNDESASKLLDRIRIAKISETPKAQA